MPNRPIDKLPEWLPKEVQRYLEHTEGANSLRQLARENKVHPSTILRQIRRVESRRDDPLIDFAIAELAALRTADKGEQPRPSLDTQDALEAAALEPLARLSQSGAVLAVANGLENAVVVRQCEGADSRLAVRQGLAGIMALLGWINCSRTGRLRRYHITALGRSVYSRQMAVQENRARTNRERDPNATQSAMQPGVPQRPKARRARYGPTETPLDVLARLKDKSGAAFLTLEQVAAGKRLREDYELAQVGEHLMQTRAYFEAAGHCGSRGQILPSPASRAAKQRATEALCNLGTGLSDIALRCCCHLQGIEAAERQLGWSARSGKIVLRIALSQLKNYYEQWDREVSDAADTRMIG